MADPYKVHLCGNSVGATLWVAQLRHRMARLSSEILPIEEVSPPQKV